VIDSDWDKKSARADTCCPLPLLEAFALPGLVGTSNGAEASRKHVSTPGDDARASLQGVDNTYPHMPLTVAAILTNPESCEVSNSQERTLSKRFFINMSLPWQSAKAIAWSAQKR